MSQPPARPVTGQHASEHPHNGLILGATVDQAADLGVHSWMP